MIADHPTVREALVVASGASAADTRLVAYVVGDPAVGPDNEADLRDHCAVGLASYMVPSVWVFLDALPLNPNGKVDRKALPAPDLGGGREIVAAGSAVEADITEVWRNLLGQDEVGVTETFFDVGGNSLLLIRLAHLLTGQFSVAVSVQHLLRHSTIRAQAELVATLSAEAETGAGAGEGGATGTTAEADEADEAVAAGAAQAAARRGRRPNRRRRGR